eukprot:13311147-Alexandrium_andersonii.AAC.1
MEGIIGAVASLRASAWNRPLAPSELPEYKRRMALRFRSQARHIMQAVKKNPKTGWVVQLWGASGGLQQGG